MKNNFIFWSASVGVFLFIIAAIIGGLQIEGYSHISQYISESYANGLPDSQYLRYAFILSGICFAIFGFLMPFVLPKSRPIKVLFLLFAIFYGLGTIVTGVFPCDIGCVMDPNTFSLSQFIHNLTGFLTYLIVPFSVILLGVYCRKQQDTKKFARTSFVSGTIALVFVLVLFSNPESKFIGLFQRIIEASILFWIMTVAFYVKKGSSR
ncbi:DUF998 domain-containing protein [Maribacter sp. HTCC2170]|uniref:DUF998 domain-containing protein n=1 Tax=Maribacter sp. (strain HTCC2170 / KCCM 42371) TaxID=313603 RepID=UPI00006BD21E|nr:DUF998 domain-containing protein [Maribacter sp. HTCC2170]EAR02323.1 predicted membrane protein [Maribacter sp. HTCC2170]